MTSPATARPALLAHLTMKLVSQRENFATEALAFVLNSSATARSVLYRVLAERVPAFPVVSRVSTQVAAGEESRPDVTLLDVEGHVLGYIEAKFWASLTDAQPAAYVERLRPGAGKVIVFLMPDRRVASLRSELRDRCEAAKQVVELVPGSPDLVADGVRLAVLSWRGLLSLLRDACFRAGETAIVADIEQLESLCAAFETHGYIPLSREELDDLDVPRRVMSLADLSNAIVEQATASGLLTIGRLRQTHGWYAAGRYAQFRKAGVWIGLSHRRWAEHGHPLWARFTPSAWGRANDLRRAFEPMFASDPPRAFVAEDDAVIVPIIVRAGASKDDAVAYGVEQLHVLADAMDRAGIPDLSSETPAPAPET